MVLELGSKVLFNRTNGQIWRGVIIGCNRLTGEYRISYKVDGFQKGF